MFKISFPVAGLSSSAVISSSPADQDSQVGCGLSTLLNISRQHNI